jgi:hypothetical protein
VDEIFVPRELPLSSFGGDCDVLQVCRLSGCLAFCFVAVVLGSGAAWSFASCLCGAFSRRAHSLTHSTMAISDGLFD